MLVYSYFAKLQLNSLAVRGVSLSQGRLSTERKEFANMAISAAASILTFVLEEEDMRRAMVGTPLYVHTMIAFASVFLMKVATRWNRVMGLNVEPHYVSHLLERMIVLLKSSITSDRHLLYHIAYGLEKMLAKVGPAALKKSVPNKTPAPRHPVDESGNEVSPGQDSVISYGHMGYGPGGIGENHNMIEEAVVRTGSGGSGGWGSYGSADGAGIGRQDFLGDVTVMNDSMIYEAFGGEPSNDVYNLLSSQFSY